MYNLELRRKSCNNATKENKLITVVEETRACDGGNMEDDTQAGVALRGDRYSRQCTRDISAASCIELGVGRRPNAWWWGD